MPDARTIAVISGNRTQREYFVSALAPLGHAVFAGESLDEIQKTRSDQVVLDVILVDEAAADGNADELVALRLEPRGLHLPILVILRAEGDAEHYLQSGFSGVVRENTSQAEIAALVETHLQLRKATSLQIATLLEDARIGLFRMTNSGAFIRANSTLVGMLGYDSEAELCQAVTAGDQLPWPPAEPASLEADWTRSDGTSIRVLQRTHPLLSADGRVLGFEGMVEDLTERQMMEESLVDHAARLTLALDAARMGDFEYDFRKDEFDSAELVLGLLGYHKQPPGRQGILLIEHVHPDDVEGLKSSILGATSEQATWEHEFRVLWPDGSTHWLVARGEVFFDHDRQPDRLIGVLRDATAERTLSQELIAAKQEAEKNAELKSIFLANMSHEIRTPLTAIIGFASLLATRVPAEHRHAVMRIQQGGHRLLETLNAVLTLARLESEQMTFELQPVDVVSEARSVLQMFEDQARLKGLRLAFSKTLKERETGAMTDPGAFSSILQNLVGNAIKFTERGEVRVRVEEEHDDNRDWVWIRVIDTGFGIDEAFLEHLFEAFRQESTGLHREYEGTGLGLAISHRLTEALGGRLLVESTKGEGSMFSVRFPATRVPPQPRTSGAAALSREHSDRRPRLMVVEDNADTRDLLQTLLEDRFDVRLIGSGREAIQLGSEQSFDLVLMDIDLGDGPSGAEVASSLRSLPSYHDVPIIALTAYALPGDAERFLSMGFAAHLPKPFHPIDLLDILDSIDQSTHGA